MEHDELDAEKRIGRNIRRLREVASLTQADLARKLESLGFKFHQTQVAKVERGERPLRVNEWIGFGEALGVAPEALLDAGPGTDDRLFEARMMYERMRSLVDSKGKELYDLGQLYAECVEQFIAVRAAYREICAEFEVSADDPKLFTVFEAVEKLREAGAVRPYAREWDESDEWREWDERDLREGAGQ